jgi:hypothetical protein
VARQNVIGDQAIEPCEPVASTEANNALLVPMAEHEGFSGGGVGEVHRFTGSEVHGFRVFW